MFKLTQSEFEKKCKGSSLIMQNENMLLYSLVCNLLIVDVVHRSILVEKVDERWVIPVLEIKPNFDI